MTTRSPATSAVATSADSSSGSAAAFPKEETFSAFLTRYREKLKEVFDGSAEMDELNLSRSFPSSLMEKIRSCDPLSACIPREFGGRGGHIHEGMAILAESSYRSLSLGLTFGINWALFLQPVAKYGQEQVKAPVFRRILRDKEMGGLMITEPDFGSDALNMRTSYRRLEGAYRVEGIKHWGGLTGLADFWLLTARERGEDGNLRRDIDFFVCDARAPGQTIHVEELYNSLGLYHIPYGRNRIDVRIPDTQRLEAPTTGVKMLLDLLHRSRLQFPGMGVGLVKRLMDEGLSHCKTRHVGGRPLFHYDQVQKRLARIQASFTACSALCARSSREAELDHDLSRHGLEANATKAVVTDLMHGAAQSLLQLMGATGYRLDHIAGRSVVDSRPFQIFEGSNDILYQQISEAVLKLMRKVKEKNLLGFLRSFDATSRGSGYLKELLDFEFDPRMPQRKLVELGRALARILTLERVLELGDLGFREELISNCVSTLQDDIAGLLSTYRTRGRPLAVEDYEGDGSWLGFVVSEG